MKLTRTAEKIVHTLLKAKGSKLDIWQLSRECGYLVDVIQSVESLKRSGIVETRDSTVYLKNGAKLPRYVFKKERPLKDVMREYADFRRRVMFEDNAYDQLALLPGSIENKLSVMSRRNDLCARDIVCLGDDDLFSIACSLTGLPKSITVFDADEKVTNFLRKVSSRLPVEIKTVNANLLQPLPKRHQSSFDVFITEPPDTVKGTLLFVSRGVQMLREHGSFYLGMTEIALNKKQWLQIQQIIGKSNILFTDIIYDCEEYELDGKEQFDWKGFDRLPQWITESAQEPWFVSTLLRGEIVGQKKPIRFSLRGIEKELVTDHFPH